MIKKITMRNCATYDENGIELSDCSKVNFIYGSNGSGKSTISNYFQDITEPKYADCTVEWEFNQPLEVLVYNRHFKESNFSGDIDGIFTLGKAYGFNNFKIVPSPTKENTYQIQRPDGSLASNTLSEGEETFISFLYFLQLTKGATDIRSYICRISS